MIAVLKMQNHKLKFHSCCFFKFSNFCKISRAPAISLHSDNKFPRCSLLGLFNKTPVSIMHQSIPAATIPPPRDSVGHLYAYLSPRPGICSCVFTRGLGICQYRVITPGHLSLTEKRPRPRVSFVVCQNGRVLNMLNKFYIILLLNVGFQV